MNAYIITVKGNKISETGAEVCMVSSKKVKNSFTIKKFDAVTPEMANTVLFGNGLKWNYPWEGEKLDIATGLLKKAYPTADPNKRIACAMSHWLLWNNCAKEDKPFLIMEHDAKFVKKLDYESILVGNFDIVGINSPASATRKAHEFHDKVRNTAAWLQPAPTIDEFNIPQGIAGNSAYIIKPAGAKKMLELVKKHGVWPNDAIMCRQLVPNLGVTKTYFTEVQGLPSLTTQ